MPAKPIVIDGWQKGIADSAFQGFASMKLVDIETFPGSLKVQKKPSSLFHTSYSSTFTADAGTDTCTSSSTVPDTGTAVTVSTTTTLPSGLSASTNYFIIKLSSTTFKLATNISNANAATAIDITSTGTGTHTVTTVNPGTINHIVKEQRTGVLFMQDSNARVWYVGNGATRALLLNGNTTTSGAGNGIVPFRTSDGSAIYLFVFRNAAIDVATVTTSSNLENPTWSNSWQTLNSGSGSGNSHHAIVGQDNIVYFCDDRYVGTIREIGVFAPGTGSTYAYSNQALDIPQSDIAQWLCELGSNLLIAGNNTNKIYPWDRLSDSFSLPIEVPERSIKKIINSGGIVYILAGVYGNIYTTQGSYTRLFRKIPSYLMNANATIQQNRVTWGGIAIRNGALLVGVAGLTSGNSGVYLVYPDGRLVMDSMPSTGSANVTAIYAEDDFYNIGYSGGADYFDATTGRYSSQEAIVQTEFFKIADKKTQGTLSRLEMQAAKPDSGSVRFSYRTNLNASFTTLTTFTGDGSTTSWSFDMSLNNLENIQIQMELSGSIEPMHVLLVP